VSNGSTSVIQPAAVSPDPARAVTQPEQTALVGGATAPQARWEPPRAAAAPTPTPGGDPRATAGLLQQGLGNQVTRRLVEASSSPPASTRVTPALGRQMAEAGAEGRPLSARQRRLYEARAGRDLSAVRFHVGPHSGAAARSAQAKAFTVGQNVYFDPANYQPETTEGRSLITHELGNVVRNRPGVVARQPVDAPTTAQEAESLEEGWQLENAAAQELEATTQSIGVRGFAHRLGLLLNELRPNSFTSEDQLVEFLDRCHQLAPSEAATLTAVAKTLPRQRALDEHPVALPITWAQKIYDDFHVETDFEALRIVYQLARSDALAIAEGISDEVWARGLPLTIDQAADLGEDDIDRLVVPFSRAMRASVDVFDRFVRALLQWLRTSHHYGFATGYESYLVSISAQIRRGDLVVGPAIYGSIEKYLSDWRTRLQAFADAAATPHDLEQAFRALDIQIKKGKFHHKIVGNLTFKWPAEGLDAFWGEVRQVDRKIAGASFDDSIARALIWAFERDFFTAAGLEVWEGVKENGWKILATAVGIIIAQYVPYVNVALDVILIIEFGFDVIQSITELADAFKDAGSAKSVVDLEHASAQLARVLTGTGAKILLWAIAWGAGKFANKATQWRQGKQFLEKQGNSREARDALAQHKGDVAKAERTLLEKQRLRAERAEAERLAAERARTAEATGKPPGEPPAEPTTGPPLETVPPVPPAKETPPASPPTPTTPPKGPQPPGVGKGTPPTPPMPPKAPKVEEAAAESLSVTARLRGLKGKAKEAKWVTPKQELPGEVEIGPGLRAHFEKHGGQVGAASTREYDLSARQTIQNGRRFFYKDRASGDSRVGYWDPKTGFFTATSETRGAPVILTHFAVAWEELRKLPGFTGR
jgi:hypothetical protein